MEFTPQGVLNTQNFSGSRQPDENFQVENMVYKLKKVKKKRRAENYKNIEPLVNIHDTADADANTNTNTNTNTYSKKADKKGGGKKIIEGYMDPDLDKKENWYGHDPVEDKGMFSESIVDKIIRYVNFIYNFFDFMLFLFAKTVASVLTASTFNNEDDIKVLKRNIAWFFCILVSWITVFNWYFIMFYKTSFGERIPLNKDFYRSNLKMKEVTDANSAIYKIIVFWFEFSFFFPEFIQEYCVIWIPSILESFCNKTTLFVFLFFFMISFVYNYPSRCRTFIVDSLTQNGDNMMIVLMLTIVVYLFFASLVTLDYYGIMKTSTNILSIISNPIMIFVIIVCHIVRFIFSMLCSVPTGGMFSMIYLFMYSFFGINITTMQVNPLPYRKKIWEYIKPPRDFLKKEPNCRPFTIWEKLMNLINRTMDFLYKFSFWIALFYMLFIGCFDYTNIKDDFLRMVLIGINAFCILFLGFVTYNQYKEDLAEEAEELLKPKKTGPPPNFLGDSFDVKPTQKMSEAFKQSGLSTELGNLSSGLTGGLPSMPTVPTMPTMPTAKPLW